MRKYDHPYGASRASIDYQFSECRWREVDVGHSQRKHPVALSEFWPQLRAWPWGPSMIRPVPGTWKADECKVEGRAASASDVYFPIWAPTCETACRDADSVEFGSWYNNSRHALNHRAVSRVWSTPVEYG